MRRTFTLLVFAAALAVGILPVHVLDLWLSTPVEVLSPQMPSYVAVIEIPCGVTWEEDFKRQMRLSEETGAIVLLRGCDYKSGEAHDEDEYVFHYGGVFTGYIPASDTGETLDSFLARVEPELRKPNRTPDPEY